MALAGEGRVKFSFKTKQATLEIEGERAEIASALETCGPKIGLDLSAHQLKAIRTGLAVEKPAAKPEAQSKGEQHVHRHFLAPMLDRESVSRIMQHPAYGAARNEEYPPAFDMLDWQRCEDRTISKSDFEGLPCVIGVGFYNRDAAARVTVFRRELYISSPTPGAQNSRASHYYFFLEFAHSAGGADLDRMRASILSDRAKFQIAEIAYDPWESSQFVSSLGISLAEVRPTAMNISVAMKEWEHALRSGRIHHGGCAAFTQGIANFAKKVDAAGNILPFPRRADPTSAVIWAALMAMCRSMMLPHL